MNAIMEAPATLRGGMVRKPATQRVRQTAPTKAMRWKTLLEQQALLQEEIKRGKDYLDSAQTELAERKSRLEEWPAYERQCGVQCLPDLTETVVVNKRIERFLTGWLKRRQGRLAAVEHAIELLLREDNLERQHSELVPTTLLGRHGDCHGSALRAAA